MEIGYSITSRQSLDVSSTDAGSTMLRRVRAARDAGFDYVQAGDHHVVSDAQYFQNVPTLGRLTAEFDHVGGMFLLPLYDPVLLAEQVGTLAAFTSQFDMWCAVGYVEDEFDAFGVPLAERGARFEEMLELLRLLWSEDDVTYEGTYYSVDGVTINPKALPRVCIGGGAKPAVQRAGRLGDAWVGAPGVSLDELEQKLVWFTEAGGGDVVLRRDVLVLEDGDEAHRRATELLESGYRGWSMDDRDHLVIGGPDEVESELGRLSDLGVDEVVVRPMVGEDVAEIFRVVSRAGERVD